MRVWIALAMLAFGANSVGAQVFEDQGLADWRLQTLTYVPDTIYELNVGAGFHVTLVFAAGEQVQSIALGDNSAWEVTPSGRGDMVFVTAGNGAQPTNMTVITDTRTYIFGLATGFGSAPWMVRFDYPAPMSAAAEIEPDEPAAELGYYRLGGSRDLQPIEMGDDGRRTYIRWASDQALPAVFAEDASGEEAIVDGQVREGMFVIDRVYSELVFRHGRRRARARRVEQE